MIVTTEKGRIQIQVSSELGGLLRVKRQHPSGVVMVVRGMDLASLSGGAFLGWDYEMPVGLPVVYTAEIYADPNTLLATSAPGTVTWSTAYDWLKDPLEPSRNLPVQLQTPQGWDMAIPSGVHQVWNRPDPVVVTSVAQSSTGSFQFLTETKDERDRMRFILSTGDVLLVQSTQASGVGSMYVAPLSFNEAPISVRDDPGRIWTVGYQEVGVPAGAASAAFPVWQDVADVPYATWADVAAAASTWLDLFTSIENPTQRSVTTWRGA